MKTIVSSVTIIVDEGALCLIAASWVPSPVLVRILLAARLWWLNHVNSITTTVLVLKESPIYNREGKKRTEKEKRRREFEKNRREKKERERRKREKKEREERERRTNCEERWFVFVALNHVLLAALSMGANKQRKAYTNR